MFFGNYYLAEKVTSTSFNLSPIILRDSPRRAKCAATSIGVVPVTLYMADSSSFFGERLMQSLKSITGVLMLTTSQVLHMPILRTV